MRQMRVIFAACGAAAICATAAPTAAQPTDYEAIVRIMRECAKIAEVPARVACYDNTIGAERLIASGQATARVGQPQPAGPPPSPAAVPAPRTETFGGESLPRPPAPQPPREAEGAERAEMVVNEARELSRGIYRLTLEDGAIWEFTDAVPFSYSPPRKGARIEIRRAALGSFVMDYADQRGVRVQRIR